MAKRRIRNTENRINRLMKKGRGQGFGPDYQPFIMIQDFSSKGRVHRRFDPKIGRIAHLLSDGEEDVHLELLADPRVVDIREQYPLERTATIIIAKELGVPHPQAHGVDTVMTTDFLVDLVGGRRIALAVKQPADLKKRRVQQKLDIEKRYWWRRDIEWWLIVTDEPDRDARLNRQEVAEWGVVDDLVDMDESYWLDRCGTFLLNFADDGFGCMLDFTKRLETRHGWKPGEGITVMKRLLAMRMLLHVGDGRLDMMGPVSQLCLLPEA